MHAVLLTVPAVRPGKMGVPVMWTIFMVALAKKTALYLVGKVYSLSSTLELSIA